jgi:hypothetical protein
VQPKICIKPGKFLQFGYNSQHPNQIPSFSAFAMPAFSNNIIPSGAGDQCAVGIDGQLLDVKDIVWMHNQMIRLPFMFHPLQI